MASVRFVVTLFALIGLTCAATTVEQYALAGGCSTTVVSGLSTQLINEVLCLSPGTMKSIANKSYLNLGSAVFPWLQSPAASALISAVNSKKTTMNINSALRTLPQQYLLYRWANLGLCGITAAAAPGRSNHNGGLAIDIDSYSSWTSHMSDYDWVWYGNGDKVHFTYEGSGTKDLNSLSTKAFQILWNDNNPSDTISEDGQYGPQTEARLQKSPANGFAIGPSCKIINEDGEVKYIRNRTRAAVHTSKQTTDYSCTALWKGDLVNGTCNTASACFGTLIGGYCQGFDATYQCCVSGVQGSTNQHIDTQGVDLIKSFEGFYPNFYYDSVGIKTIGYGHACHVDDCSKLMAKDSNGNWRQVYPPLSETDASDLLRGDMEKGGYESCIQNNVQRTITDDQFSALVSFVFNVGCGGFQSSTLRKRVEANAQLEGSGGIREAFLMWNKAGGQVLSGLTRRRNAEADLYGGSDYTPAPTSTDYIGADCWYNSQKGICLDESSCSGTTHSGLCQGPSSVKCCISTKCTISTSNDGVCIPTSSCSTSYKSGLCPGASDVKCCKLKSSKEVYRNVSEKRQTSTDPSYPVTVPCPDGTSYNASIGFCSDGTYVWGPFPQGLIAQCVASGGGGQCLDYVKTSIQGRNLRLPRYAFSVFMQARGYDDCPWGTLRGNVSAIGECVEALVDTVTNYTTYLVYGAINQSVAEACDNQAGGISCWTTRYSMKYYTSLVQPRLEVNVDGSDDPSVNITDTTLIAYDNPFVSEQLQLNQDVADDGSLAATLKVSAALVVLLAFALIF